nr:hypothetical protein [Tanacetum cinerariifolium]
PRQSQAAARPVRNHRFSGAHGRPHPAHRAHQLGVSPRRLGGRADEVELGRIQQAAHAGLQPRYSLRHEVVEVRYPLARRERGHAAGARQAQARGQVCDPILLRRLYHQLAAGRPARRQSLRGLAIRGPAAGARARRPGPAGGAAPLLLEKRQAERSYSIASPPEQTGEIALTVELVNEGEVSGYLFEGVAVGDELELRGPIGGYFVWRGEPTSPPLLLVGGGSGVVPLMAMLRHRQHLGLRTPAVLLFSVRTPEE